jgi:hypothetical protein
MMYELINKYAQNEKIEYVSILLQNFWQEMKLLFGLEQ